MADNVASTDVGHDQLVLIKIEGMHCHKCEESIQRALDKIPGVYEAEVDFNAAMASVLFDRGLVSVGTLVEAITQAGYRTTGYTQRSADRAV